MNFMNNIGINVQLPYAVQDITKKMDFCYDLFDKQTMLISVGEKVFVKEESQQYTIDTLNRFFGIVTSTKLEVFQVQYDDENRVKKILERFSAKSFLEAYAPLTIFLKFWWNNVNRIQYKQYVFEPERKIKSDEFNIFLGLKMHMEKHSTMEYDSERIRKFQDHVRTYFCRNNTTCYNYFMNYFARKVQCPGQKNGVGIVLKSAKQGVGKGLIIDMLLGKAIFGETAYVQVGNMDGLVGKFNSILMNKILVNVDEVSMTKAQANEVKGMITGDTMMFEKKGLDKITLKNHMDFVFTSNNDFCVIIDIHDRRYFILDIDDSNANDQLYYLPFKQYCHDPETAIHVYRYLMSIDISSFNPRDIPDTEEKQLYREQAIPMPVRFVQYFVETSIDNDNWISCRHISPDIFFTDFDTYCNMQREQKKWSAKQFQMCITKYLGLKASTRDQTNNGNKRYYDLGECPHKYILFLKDKKLFSSF